MTDWLARISAIRESEPLCPGCAANAGVVYAALDQLPLTKRCAGCGIELPLSAFWAAPTARDGLERRCESCCRSRMARANGG